MTIRPLVDNRRTKSFFPIFSSKNKTKSKSVLNSKPKMTLSFYNWMKCVYGSFKEWIALKCQQSICAMFAKTMNVQDKALLEFQERWSQQRILKPDEVSLSNFHRVNKTLGGGTYGKVELVYANQQYYAMKIISNISTVHMVFECVQGGDFFDFLATIRSLKELEVLFYASQMVMIVEYLQARNLVHRDLKPENFLFCTDGYLKLADFGASKLINGQTGTVCGTNACMAPEMVQRHYNDTKLYTKAVDLWSLGVLIFEMANDNNPFYDDRTQQLYDNILHRNVKSLHKENLSPMLKDLIDSLLERDLVKRLGAKCILDIQNHSWFCTIDWQRLYYKQYLAPYLARCDEVGEFSHYYDVQRSKKIYRSLHCSAMLDDF